ncbi:hypothetical protein [Jeotgalibacillus sp. R-1-5s-1]|uniref:hypothetical protein n=1 Tax=Jeotgalibacillus sp. R-1-5s-1 TaxID=2555897 RepID=UPI00106D9820|nr:hypothetical protein [Jeotgalibacillus sp. R-1-5s-1]TFD96284.1 hypothetical protein E2491_11010 [Jeotgalibacillus sp. R-1-5s-1]
MARIISYMFSLVSFGVVLVFCYQSGIWFNSTESTVLNSICIAAMILCVILIALNARKRNKDTSI